MFLGRDPLDYDGGSNNLYEYVASAPTLYTDPLGSSFAVRPAPFGCPAPEPLPPLQLPWWVPHPIPEVLEFVKNYKPDPADLLNPIVSIPERAVVTEAKVLGPALKAEGTAALRYLFPEVQTVDIPITYYRTMSHGHYEQLLNTGRIPATGETFISPSLQYSSNFRGVKVRVEVAAGTQSSLLQIGSRSGKVTWAPCQSLPVVKRGWTYNQAFFKLEGDTRPVVNIGLGKGEALDRFNNSILQYMRVPGQ